jgi:multiple sugar transport system substrate-binding protein
VLGGTGIAVSAECTHQDAAIAFCLFVAGRDCQSHLYGMCGGQPASKTAWQNPLLNRISGNFFERTLASIESAYVRPRYPGYIALQGSAGVPIAGFLQGELNATQTVEAVDRLYRQSLCKTRNEREGAR